MIREVMKIYEEDEDIIKVEFKGNFNDLFNSFDAVCRAALEGVNQKCKSKGEVKSAQIELMDRYLRTFMEINPSGLLVLYDQLTSGILEMVNFAGNTEPKKKFLDAMMEIITTNFEKFKEDCEKHD